MQSCVLRPFLGNSGLNNKARPGGGRILPPRARVAARKPGRKRERVLWESGYELVAGVDEVGRGAWAGPLSVGVAVLREPVARMPRGLRDSKQIAEVHRERLFEKVAAWCDGWAVGHTSAEECDRYGMTVALVTATRRAFAQLPTGMLPEAVVLDGNFDFVSRACNDHEQVLPPEFRPVVHKFVKADASCVSVAAASVLAKVTRDRLMRELSDSYPAFEFDRNKGYPSPTHKRALRGYGLSAIHRRSWIFAEWLPWSDPYKPERSGLDGGLLRESEDAFADDVAQDLVGAPGYAHGWDPEDELGPGEGSPFA